MTRGISYLAFCLLLFSAQSAVALEGNPSPTPSAQRTVTLKWAASTSASVLGYKIYWGTGSQNYQNVADVKNTLSCSLLLSSTGECYVSARAYNLFGESVLSNEVVVTAVASAYN